MRKLLTILALLGLATGFAVLTTRADTTIAYEVDGTFSADPLFPTTSIANVGDKFMLTFSVGSGALGTIPVACLPNLCMSNDITVPFVYTDLSTPGLSLDGTGIVNFFTPGNGGLFSLMFTDSITGNTFMFELVAEGCFISTSPLQCGGFTNNSPPILNLGGPFTLDDTLSALGEFGPSCVTFCVNDISDGTSTATSSAAVPEPSSLLLLGSGFLALGGFARKRLSARFD